MAVRGRAAVRDGKGQKYSPLYSAREKSKRPRGGEIVGADADRVGREAAGFVDGAAEEKRAAGARIEFRPDFRGYVLHPLTC